MRRKLKRDNRLAALLEASRAVTSSLDLDPVLRVIAGEAAKISDASFVRLFLLEGETPVLRCQVGVGVPSDAEAGLVVPVQGTLSGEVVATGRPLAVADSRDDPRVQYPEHAHRYGLVSYLGLPVKSQERVLGVLVFNTPTPREYPQDEIAFLNAFAQQAAIAIENARLYREEQRRRQQLETVRAVAAEITQELNLTALL